MFKSYHRKRDNADNKKKKKRNDLSYTPIQLASIYQFPESDGKGQTIGIIELGGGYNLKDITTYLKNLGITIVPNITSISVDGISNNPSGDEGDNIEVVLDLEIIAAIVPAANIRVYFAPNSDKGFCDAIQQAIDDNCNIISISWGDAECNWDTKSITTMNDIFKKAYNKNISIIVASGDNGSSDGEKGTNVDFPASSPFVIACGGTTLIANGNSIVSETVWDTKPKKSATGGGISEIFQKPIFQEGISILSKEKFRGIPDISANADPDTGYSIYMEGETMVIGGTSAAAPLWAGLIARINSLYSINIGTLNSFLYSKSLISQVCRDITEGNNGEYKAGTGWDFCTGWGTPTLNFVNLFASK